MEPARCECSLSPQRGEGGVRGDHALATRLEFSRESESWAFPPLIRPLATFSPLRGEGTRRASLGSSMRVSASDTLDGC